MSIYMDLIEKKLNSLKLKKCNLKDFDKKNWGKKKGYLQYIDNNWGVLCNFDTQNFIINKLFPIRKRLSPYGDCILRIKGQEVYLLNTYGAEDDYPCYVFFCACIIYDNKIEVADFAIEDGQIIRQNHMIGKIPKRLFKKLLFAKRSFYFYRKHHRISLRCQENKYDSVPSSFQHKMAKDWASGPRVWVKKLKRVQ